MNNQTDLTVLRNLNGNPLIYCLLHIQDEGKDRFLGELYFRGAENNLLSYISELIIKDKNPLSLNCAKGVHPSEYVISAFYEDVKTLFDAAKQIQNPEEFNIGEAKFDLEKGRQGFQTVEKFYMANGYGHFIGNIAYDFDGTSLKPIENITKTRLSDLKNYESEKAEVIFNIENFLSGAPFYNTLLYGDRGTGKSSTVQAILNEYQDRGLRLIQLDKQYIGRLNDVRELVRETPLKFMIFIDDLTLSNDEPEISAFKAALEGTVSCWNNCMIIATSNRRHIIKESFADRDNDIHPDDNKQDTISLSDRFGLTVLFSSTNKEQYLSIVSQLAKDYGIIQTDLDILAERWALIHSGRSPRTAKQFCLYVLACKKAGKEIDF